MATNVQHTGRHAPGGHYFMGRDQIGQPPPNDALIYGTGRPVP